MDSRHAGRCCLAVIVVQNATLIVAACYSRALPGPRYLGSVAVLLTEVLKALAVVACGVYSSGSAALQAELRTLCARPPFVAAFALPAACYCLHNNLWYVAVTHLDPVTVAVGTQTKVVFAALFAVRLLGKRLGKVRWAAISLLSAGLMLVESSAPSWQRPSRAASGAADGADGGVDRARGLLALFSLCALSGLAGAGLDTS